jgi:hypothetical protein
MPNCGGWVTDLLEVTPNDQVLEVGLEPGVVIQRLAKRAGAPRALIGPDRWSSRLVLGTRPPSKMVAWNSGTVLWKAYQAGPCGGVRRLVPCLGDKSSSSASGTVHPDLSYGTGSQRQILL